MSDSEDTTPKDIRSRIAAFEGGAGASSTSSNSARTRASAAVAPPKKLAPPALPSSAKKPGKAQSASPNLNAGSTRPTAAPGGAAPSLRATTSSTSSASMPPRPPLSSKPTSSNAGPSPVSPRTSSNGTTAPGGADELSTAFAKRKAPALPPAATKPVPNATSARAPTLPKATAGLDASQAKEAAEADTAAKIGSVKAARDRLALQHASPSLLPVTPAQPPPPRAAAKPPAAKPAVAVTDKGPTAARPSLPPRLPSREVTSPSSESARPAADPFGDVSQLDALFIAPSTSSPTIIKPAERSRTPSASADPFGDSSGSWNSTPPARARLSPPVQEQRNRSPSQPALPSRAPAQRAQATFDFDGNSISSSSKPVLPLREKAGGSRTKPAPAFIDFPETVNFGSSSSASSSLDKYGYDKPVQRTKTLSGYASSIRDAYSAASSASGRPSSKTTSYSDSFSNPPARSNTLSARSSGPKEYSYDDDDTSDDDNDNVRTSRNGGSRREEVSHNPMFSRPHDIDNSGGGGRAAAAPISGSSLSTFATRAPLVKSDINGAQAASKTGMDADLWATARYRELFDGMLRAVQEDSTPGHEGRLEADVVRQIWAQSKLSDRVLERIWEEGDAYEKGSLDKKSFCDGMLLIDEEIKIRKR